MSKRYEAEFRKKIVYLHLEEGRTLKGLAAEYGVSKSSISIWVKQFREECTTDNKAKLEYNRIKENQQLKKQLAEVQKEINMEILAVIEATNMLSCIKNVDIDCKEFVEQFLTIIKPILFLDIGYHNIQYLNRLIEEYERVSSIVIVNESEKDAE